MMEFYSFAFLDSNNNVINIAVFDSPDPDIELLNSMKNQINAVDFKSCSIYGEASMGGLFIGHRFVEKQPYPSWVLNNETFVWESPIGNPVAPYSKWNEETLSWTPKVPIE